MNGYAMASTITERTDGRHLDLATADGLTPDGRVQHPAFFSGVLARPDIAGAGLLAVADVAASRYADAGLAKRLANLDPVVTASGDRLRFESFSGCNGVHARFDLLQGGVAGSAVSFGTTNVDINLPLRTALARVNEADLLHLSIGSEELRASSLHETHVERKVALPDRWVRGLAEVPSVARSMQQVAELRGPRVQRFLAGLPRVAAPGPSVHVVPFPSGWRTSRAPVRDSVLLVGASRLRGSDRIARLTQKLTLHVSPNGTTGWVFEMQDARFTLLVSPDPYRGFSGEGSLLRQLVRDDAEPIGQWLAGWLGWAPIVEPAAIADDLAIPVADVEAGLAWLSAAGRVGYDLSDRAWFHRELPVDSAKVLRRNPRLVSARHLLDSGGVSRRADVWLVRGSNGQVYQVDPVGRCECLWEQEHNGSRGPCKHILAVLLSLEATRVG